jgi:hypothetical protein
MSTWVAKQGGSIKIAKMIRNVLTNAVTKKDIITTECPICNKNIPPWIYILFFIGYG